MFELYVKLVSISFLFRSLDRGEKRLRHIPPLSQLDSLTGGELLKPVLAFSATVATSPLKEGEVAASKIIRRKVISFSSYQTFLQCALFHLLLTRMLSVKDGYCRRRVPSPTAV
jgi:hypothetical protein